MPDWGTKISQGMLEWPQKKKAGGREKGKLFSKNSEWRYTLWKSKELKHLHFHSMRSDSQGGQNADGTSQPPVARQEAARWDTSSTEEI